jgi:hypothetical protein
MPQYGLQLGQYSCRMRGGCKGKQGLHHEGPCGLWHIENMDSKLPVSQILALPLRFHNPGHVTSFLNFTFSFIKGN